MNEPLFFKPVFKERIWGGTALRSFGYDIPSEITGECWAFSAHPHGQSIVKNGSLAGKNLEELWENHHELFGNIEGDRFPLLTKILDANQDLSVQVHPNDDYAKVHENGELGKTECWYIIDCQEGAEIIFGHHANTKDELTTMIAENKWDELLNKVPVKKVISSLYLAEQFTLSVKELSSLKHNKILTQHTVYMIMIVQIATAISESCILNSQLTLQLFHIN